jgi:thiol-disulfide isomerase/thioredoxin
MSVARLTYEEFVSSLQVHPQNPLDTMAPAEKIVYVYALTRDLCSGCETQKPLYECLASKISEKYGDRVKFGVIHVSQQDRFRLKILDFRRMLKFAAYPTYLILLRTEVGVVEVYRGIEPPMEEIARNIDTAVELANR